MQTKQVIVSIYDRDLSWALPEGTILVSCDYSRDPSLDWDERLVTVTYGTAAEACAQWGVNFVGTSLNSDPLFAQRPRYINRYWMQAEARAVAALEA